MLQTVTLKKSAESSALQISAYTFIISTVLSFIVYNSYNLVPFAPGTSVALVVIIFSAIAALVSFVLAFKHNPNRLSISGLFDTTVLAVVCTIVTTYLVFLFLVVVAYSFRGLAFDPFTAAWLTGFAIASVAYLVYAQSANLGSRQILGLLTTSMLGGVIVSMVSSSDPQWWEHNFSTLGMYGGTGSTFAFNVTLILAGIVIAILAKYLLVPVNSREVNEWVQRPLVAMGLSLGAVGLFSYDPAPLRAFLHNGSAGLIVISFIVIIYGVRKTLPTLSREFMAFSYGCVAAILASYFLFANIGYFSLTAMELTLFTIIFAWIIVFARNVAALTPSKV